MSAMSFACLAKSSRCVDGGYRVGYGHLEFSALFFDCFRGYGHVAEVVQRIEDPYDVDTVAYRPL
jgi:hypothetical protein